MIDPLVVFVAVVVVSAAAQRLSGLGFALIATPVAVVAIGEGAVSFVALLGAGVGLASLAATWRHLRLRQVVALTAITLVTMVPVAFAVPAIPAPAASVVAGVLVVGAVAMSMAPMRGRMRRAIASPILAGALTGVAAGLAGLAGPSAAAHGLARDWGKAFMPNLQLVLLATLPLILVGHGWPSTVPAPIVLAGVVAIAAGTAMGAWLHRRVSHVAATWCTRGLATLGGFAAIAHGMREGWS